MPLVLIPIYCLALFYQHIHSHLFTSLDDGFFVFIDKLICINNLVEYATENCTQDLS